MSLSDTNQPYNNGKRGKVERGMVKNEHRVILTQK